MKIGTQRKNGMTVNEMAKKLGVNRKTIIKYISMDRDDYMTKAEQRRAKVAELIQGEKLTYQQTAEELGITLNAVKSLYKQYNKKIAEKQQSLPL